MFLVMDALAFYTNPIINVNTFRHRTFDFNLTLTLVATVLAKAMANCQVTQANIASVLIKVRVITICFINVKH